MIGRSWRFWLIGAVVAAALMTGTSQANAWWCGWGGCQPSCYTPCCTVSCDPCGDNWYLGVRPGPVRRLLLGPCRWYWSPYCAAPIAYTVCCEQTGSSVATPTPAVATPTPAVATPTPAAVESPAATDPLPDLLPDPLAPLTPLAPLDIPATEPDTEPAITPGDVSPDPSSGFPSPDPPLFPPIDPLPGAADPDPSLVPGPAPVAPIEPDPAVTPDTGTPMSFVPTRENSGLLTVWVPYQAKVTINGLLTKSKGSQRRFVSHGLKPDLDYKYVIRAEAVISVKQDPNDPQSPMVDRLVVEEDVIILTAGDRKAVAFGFNPEMAHGLAAR